MIYIYLNSPSFCLTLPQFIILLIITWANTAYLRGYFYLKLCNVEMTSAGPIKLITTIDLYKIWCKFIKWILFYNLHSLTKQWLVFFFFSDATTIFGSKVERFTIELVSIRKTFKICYNLRTQFEITLIWIFKRSRYIWKYTKDAKPDVDRVKLQLQ